jgi:hypothetical protein
MAQPLTEPRQAFEPAIHRGTRQGVVGVEARGEPHHFFQSVDDLNPAVVLLRDDEMKTIRSKIERGQLSLWFRRSCGDWGFCHAGWPTKAAL